MKSITELALEKISSKRIDAKDEAYHKIVAENECLRNKIRIIEKVLEE